MILAECFDGPLDGGTEELHEVCAVGFVHGVTMAHSSCDHPFYPNAEVDPTPALVVLYQLTDISESGSRLDFIGYVKRQKE